jgi:hypothetical protein
MAEVKITREITTRTRRELTIDEVEQALRDQYDLHVQDDITFNWDAGYDGVVHGVEIIHTERETRDGW